MEAKTDFKMYRIILIQWQMVSFIGFYLLKSNSQKKEGGT